MIFIGLRGDDVVAAQFRAHAAAVGGRVDAVVRRSRVSAAEQIRIRAPRDTGYYATTIEVDDEGVSSDHPAAHRLEAGFHGADSLGRMRDDESILHWGPGLDVATPPFLAALEREADF